MTYKNFSNNMVLATQKARAYIFSKYKLCESDVEDIIQEASLKAIKNYKKFLGKCSFNTWFISICKNEVLHTIKMKKRENIFSPEEDEFGEFGSAEPEVSRKFDIADAEKLIHEALTKLSLKHQEIIKISMQEMTSKQMATALKIPISSARTRLFYAKKKLKKILLNSAKGATIAY